MSCRCKRKPIPPPEPVNAVYRITRLITDDLIFDVPRAAVTRLGEPWASGIECPWCVSFWVACAVVAVSYAFPEAWMPIEVVFAFSAVAGFTAGHE